MSEANAAIVHRWFHDIWNRRRTDSIRELLAPESVCHAEDGPIRGAGEFVERMFTPFTSAFPDLRVEVEATIAQGHEVVVRWTAQGTHTGEGLGFPATGQSVNFRGITWVHVHDGRMGEAWQSSNIPDVIRGLAGQVLA